MYYSRSKRYYEGEDPIRKRTPRHTSSFDYQSQKPGNKKRPTPQNPPDVWKFAIPLSPRASDSNNPREDWHLELSILAVQARNSNNKMLHNLAPLLSELAAMTGMKNFKRRVVEMVRYHSLGLGSGTEEEGEFENVVISGLPGTGKSTIAVIFSRIFYLLGVVPREKIVMTGRASLIGSYIGQSERNTGETLDSAMGGVLFIDESHSMGQKESSESYSQAMADVICQDLSERKRGRVVILGGYGDEIVSRFFSLNPGLSSRFPDSKRIVLEGYTPLELKTILFKKMRSQGWIISPEVESAVPVEKFGVKIFPGFARDLENFAVRVKEVYASRHFEDFLFQTSLTLEQTKKRELCARDFLTALDFLKSSNPGRVEIPESIRIMYT